MLRTTKSHSQKYQVTGLRLEGDLKHAKRRASHYHKNVRFEANKNIGLFVTCLISYLNEVNPLNPELNPIRYLLALLAHHFLHVSRIRVKSLTLRLLMSYIHMEHLLLMFLDHTQRRSTVGRTPLDE